MHIYRKRNLVFWERFRFFPGRAPLVVPTPFGRVGLAVCADMIYRRVWDDYRDRIDLAVVSAAWPDFANRHTGRRHWLLGHVGPLSAAIPCKVAVDLGIPVIFSNQCGETKTTIPVIRTTIHDRFAGQSSICDGRHGAPVRADREPAVLGCSHNPPPQARIEIVAYYVPLGPRGFLLSARNIRDRRLWGVVYRQAASAVAQLIPSDPSLSVALAEILATE